MSPLRKKREEINENWRVELAAYDAACETEEAEYRKNHLIIRSEGCSDLTPEENEVFDSVLRGIPFDEIAEQYGVEKEVISGLVEVIRAKLSLPE